MPIINFVLFLMGLSSIFIISYSHASFWVRAISVIAIALFINRLIFG